MLHSFTGDSRGGQPTGPLVSDSAGNLYGGALTGGDKAGILGHGLIFQLSPPAVSGGKWTESVLHTFTVSDGAYNFGNLIFDHAGNLYGTTYDGGNCFYYCGVVFQLAPPAVQGGAWTYTVLHTFAGPRIGDGGGPWGKLVFDQKGNLYSTTSQGGRVFCTSIPGPCGNVFKLSPPASQGGAWTETELYSLKGVPDGAFAYSGVIFGKKGTLFASTSQGGSTSDCTDGEGLTIGCGTVFELVPTPGGGWREAVLYNFKSYEDGPGALLLGKSGDLWGAASYKIFRMTPPKTEVGAWTEHVVYTFSEGISGTLPSDELIQDAAGNLFGTSHASGLTGYGTVFKLSPPANHSGIWVETTLQTFPGGFDSVQPWGSVIRGVDGNLYGTAYNQNDPKSGYVFKIIP